MEMKQILSYPIANNYKNFRKSYNKDIISFILERNDEILIYILKQSFENVIKIYSGELIDKNFDGFQKMEDELKDDPNLEEKEKEYIRDYKMYAKNYKNTLNDIDERDSKKEKTN